MRVVRSYTRVHARTVPVRAFAPWMRTFHVRLLLVTVSSAVGVGLALWYLRTRRGPEYTLVDKSREVEWLMLERQIEPRGLEPFLLGIDVHGRLKREPLDKETAAQIFITAKKLIYDPLTYFRYAPNLAEVEPLNEHPGGQYVRRTNAAGEREDHETLLTAPDIFVLVTGDSHTDGICDNDKSFANQLEARLARSRVGKSVEVINAGVQSYCPYNYLGVLEKYLPRRPQLFISAYYGGNDFLELLRPHHYFNNTMPPPQPRGHWDQIANAKELGAEALAQGLNAILYFKRHPDEIEVALEGAIQVSAEIQRQCADAGIPWILVYIPSVFDRAWAEKAELRARSQRLLELSDHELGVLDVLADRFLEWARSNGVEVLDLRPVFGAEPGPWYWPELHIDIQAQQKIAELLEPRVEARLGAAKPATATPIEPR